MLLGKKLSAFPIVVQRIGQHPAMPLHRHGGYSELVIVTQGRGMHLLENKAFSVTPGDVFVIPADVLHGYDKCEGLELFNVIFDPRRLQLPENQLRLAPGYVALFHLEPKLRAQHQFQSRLRVDADTVQDLSETLQRLGREVKAKLPGFEAAATAHFCHIIITLARNYGTMTAPLPTAVLRLSEVAQWLEHNFQKTVNVNLLAHLARMSRSTFLRAFRECFGVSPMSYVTKLRIEKAAQLLQDPSARVKEVAPKVGIYDTSYFARVFRRQMGIDPTAFRNQQLQDLANLYLSARQLHAVPLTR